MKDIDKTDIIIVTHNAKNLLRRCILSIRKYTPENTYVITVVDNGSSDGTISFLNSQKDINVIRNNRNLGFPRAINRAIKKTNNNLIACIDDDIEITKGWLEGLTKYIRNKKVGIVGCKIVYPDGRIHAAEYRIKPRMVVAKRELDIGQKEYVRQVDGLIGPCWLMKREVVEKIGYFDERFYPCQHEDLDFCIRVRLAGYKIIYNGKLKVIHYSLFRDEGLSDKNWQKFTMKWKDLTYPFKDSHSADKYNARGYAFFIEKKFRKALIEFRKVEANNKESSVPLYIGIAELGLGNYKKAMGYFKKIISIYPEHYFSHYALGIIFSKFGKFKVAIKEYKKALKIEPGAGDIYYKIGAIYERTGKLEEARMQYRKALSSLGGPRKGPIREILKLEIE